MLDEATHLFGEHGYRGTTITKLEAAARLTPGAGGIYYHFKSKDANLAADARNRPQQLAHAVEQLLETTFTGFAAFIANQADALVDAEKAGTNAAWGLEYRYRDSKPAFEE